MSFYSEMTRQQRYQMHAEERKRIAYYGCKASDVWSYIPVEWAIFRDRNGFDHPHLQRIQDIMYNMTVM